MDKISIVIPVYNSEKYIERAILSLMNQTFKNIEIIVVNDGSTDNSEEIIKKLQKKDQRIKYIKQKNGGPSSARNHGIEKATGNYLMFLDSDDFYEIDACEILYNLIKSNNADISICTEKRINLSGNITDYISTNKIEKYNKNQILEKFFLQNTKINLSSTCGKIFSKKAFYGVKFVDGKKSNEDRFYLFNIILNSEKIVFQDRQVYVYEYHNNSLSTTIDTDWKFDNIYFAKEMKKIIHDKIPNFDDMAKYNYLKTILWLYRNHYRFKTNTKYKKKLDEIRKELIIEKTSRYLNFSEKIEIFIIKHLNQLYYSFIKTVDRIRKYER